MSWRVLLSEYPKSILSDNRAVAVLALIELEGLASETDLQSSLNVDTAECSRILLRLFQNSLILYAGSYIQLTERGRALLDRFNLSDEVIVNAISKLDLPTETDRLLRLWVAKYRAESLEDYLVTLRTARSWSRVSSSFRLSEHKPHRLDAAGGLAIWIDDLRRWLRSRGHREDSEDQTRVLFLLDNIDDVPEARTHRHLSIAVQFLDEYDRFSQKHEVEQLANRNPDTFLFLSHHCSRVGRDPSRFAAEWDMAGQCYEWFSSASKLNSLFPQVLLYAEKNWADGWNAGFAEQRHRSLIDTAIRRSVGDILLSILAAESLDDLSAKTQMTTQQLSNLLERIHVKIGELLKVPKTEERDTSDQAPAEDVAPTYKRRIAIVDDDRYFTAKMSEELRGTFVVSDFADAEEARKSICEGGFSAIILDVMMPTPRGVPEDLTIRGHDTGLWLLECIRETVIEKMTPIIILTNRDREYVLERVNALKFPEGLVVVRRKMDTSSQHLCEVVSATASNT